MCVDTWSEGVVSVDQTLFGARTGNGKFWSTPQYWIRDVKLVQFRDSRAHLLLPLLTWAFLSTIQCVVGAHIPRIWGCTFDGVDVPYIYSHARCSYRRRFRFLLLCPLSVERYYFPLFVDCFDDCVAPRILFYGITHHQRCILTTDDDFSKL